MTSIPSNHFQNKYLYNSYSENKNEPVSLHTPNSSKDRLDTYLEQGSHTEITTYNPPKTQNLSDVSRYHFHENFSLNINGNLYNLSRIEIDLYDILTGGIGRGCSAARLMANGMKAIGHGNRVYNLPFCIERKCSEEFKIVSEFDTVCNENEIKEIIKSAASDEFIYINIPLDVNGHASLASIKIYEEKAILKFYDSLSPKLFNYEERYTKELIHFIQSFLPETIQIKEGHEVLHFLDQGDFESNGCGYYSIYTALLLKDREDFKSFSVESQPQTPIFTAVDDPKIRAELAIRTLLSYGIENAKKDIFPLRYYGTIKHIFHKLEANALEKLIDSIHKRSNPFFFKFPETFKIPIKDQIVDVGGLEVNLFNLFIGGIGYGASASQLLANGMETIGSSNEVYNFPICIEGMLQMPEILQLPNIHQKLELISTSNQLIKPTEIRSKIAEVILSGYSILNIPLNLDGHASLVCITSSQGKITLKFYESLPREDICYDTRYSLQLVDFIQTLLPENIQLEKSLEVIPLLRQDKMGGGYYTLYTAHLLKELKETRMFSAIDVSLPLLDETHAKQIRAELAIRTLLVYGIKEAEESYRDVLLFGKVRHIFQRLKEDYLPICTSLRNLPQ